MDGWCGFIIFLDRVGLGIGGRMGEFDRFYAKLRRKESFLAMKNISLCRCIRYHILTSLLSFFLQSVSQNPYQSNIYIYIYIYILSILLT